MSGIEYKTTSCCRTYVGMYSLILTVALAVAMIQTAKAGSQTVALDKALEQAILAEDWKRVVSFLPEAMEPNLPAPLRLVKGHACLATNRNNESLCLFLGASSEVDIHAWQEWSRDMVNRYPGSPVAYYFRGDAFARTEAWDLALGEFNKSLELRCDHALALNARGVTSCAKGEWDSALIDLTTATMVDTSFADAYASVGAMWIQRRLGPLGALAGFEKALELSPDFALARNGKGCAEFALGRWSEANLTIAEAYKHLSCNDRILSVINHNLHVIAIAAKRAEFPFFSKFDLVDWSALMVAIRDPESILYEYFRDTGLPQDVDDDVVMIFNRILEISHFYDENSDKISLPDQSDELKPGVKQLLALIADTAVLRRRDFSTLKESEKERIRKLNRLILEYCFPRDLVQLAMGQIDAPGFSLERNAGFVNSWQHKNQLSNQQLANGLNQMETLWRPMADTVASIPVVGPAISNNWNRHLDNQIQINNDILRSRGVPDSHSGGVDFSMRRAHIDAGDWGVGTWFGLAYHVPPRSGQATD